MVIESKQKPLVKREREGGQAGRRPHCLYCKHPANSHPLRIYRCFCTNGATPHNSAPVKIPCQYLLHLHMLRAGFFLHPTPTPSPDGYSGCPWVSLPHTRLLPTSSSHTTLNTWGRLFRDLVSPGGGSVQGQKAIVKYSSIWDFSALLPFLLNYFLLG